MLLRSRIFLSDFAHSEAVVVPIEDCPQVLPSITRNQIPGLHLGQVSPIRPAFQVVLYTPWVQPFYRIAGRPMDIFLRSGRDAEANDEYSSL